MNYEAQPIYKIFINIIRNHLTILLYALNAGLILWAVMRVI